MKNVLKKYEIVIETIGQRIAFYENGKLTCTLMLNDAQHLSLLHRNFVFAFKISFSPLENIFC